MLLTQPRRSLRRVVSHAGRFTPDSVRIRSPAVLAAGKLFFKHHTAFEIVLFGCSDSSSGSLGSVTFWWVSAAWLLRWISS